jgi:hypothetical protein
VEDGDRASGGWLLRIGRADSLRAKARLAKIPQKPVQHSDLVRVARVTVEISLLHDRQNFAINLKPHVYVSCR